MTQTLLILLILYQVSQRVRPHQGTHLSLSGNLIPNISEEWMEVNPDRATSAIITASSVHGHSGFLWLCGVHSLTATEVESWKGGWNSHSDNLILLASVWRSWTLLDIRKCQGTPGQHPKTKLINCKYPDTGCFFQEPFPVFCLAPVYNVIWEVLIYARHQVVWIPQAIKHNRALVRNYHFRPIIEAVIK